MEFGKNTDVLFNKISKLSYLPSALNTDFLIAVLLKIKTKIILIYSRFYSQAHIVCMKTFIGFFLLIKREKYHSMHQLMILTMAFYFITMTDYFITKYINS